MKPVIMVVEDDDTLRYLAREALTMMDMEVIEACTADGAFTMLSHSPKVDLVFTDIRMPGQMDGLDFARLLRRKWPVLPVVVTSGHMSITQDQLPAMSAFLAKPWTLEQFVQLITAQLQNASVFPTNHCTPTFGESGPEEK